MPDSSYLFIALGLSVAITVALRALPFTMKGALADSALVANLGQWMPLGAVTILAVYCLSTIDVTAPGHGVGPALGTVVTIAVHAWRRNAVLSIITGTAACLLVSNAC